METVPLAEMRAAAEQLQKGSYGFFDAAAGGREIVTQAFAD